MSEWQPIETAPKDGTNIFVCAPGYTWPEVVRYEIYDEETALEVGDDGFWRYADDVFADLADVDIDSLTHWRSIEMPQ